jgi:hypothetical protein
MNLNQLGLIETDDADILAARMRLQRDRLLAACDWTQTADAPVDKAAWAAYRQALRDFPATWEPSEVCDFPNPPGYVEPVVASAPSVEEEVSDDAG